MLRYLLAVLVFCAFTLSSCVSGTPAPGSSTAPSGGQAAVDAQVMAQLEAALQAQLAAQGGKGISDVSGEFVDINWNCEGDDAQVNWAYNNTGDYDQNSEVNAADLVPIGLNFNTTSADTGWPYAQVADGDGNGEVNVADVTPIGVNFGSVVNNYVIEADIDGGPTWEPVANAAFSEGVAPMGSAIKQWACPLTCGARCAGFRAYAGPPVDEAELFDMTTLPALNKAPVADLAPSPASGEAPLVVTWDASGSTDSDGSIVRYDWDMDNDGSYETEDGGETQQMNYSTPGTYTVGLQVTDDDGATDSTTADVEVGEHVNVPPVANLVPSPTTGDAPLHVTWDASGSSDSDGTVMQYDWDMDNDGTYEVMDGGEQQEVDYATPDTYTVGVRVVDDKDDSDSTTADVTVTEYIDPMVDPSKWWVHTVMAGGNFGSHHAATLLNGKPYIVFNDETAGNILMACANTHVPNEVSDWEYAIVDESGNRGGEMDIVACQGVPCVVYMDTSTQQIYFAFASSDTPSVAADWTVHQPNSAGYDTPQLAVADGSDMIRLVMVYSGGMLYMQPNVPGLPENSLQWDNAVLASGVNENFWSLDMEPVGAGVGIAYELEGDGWSDLMYAYIDDSSALSAGNWTIQDIDDEELESGLYPRLTVDGNGYPVIAYVDFGATGYLKYAYSSAVYPNILDWSMTAVYQTPQADVAPGLGLAVYNGCPLMTFVEEGATPEYGLHLNYGASGAPTDPADFYHHVFDPALDHAVDGETSVLLLLNGDIPALIYHTSDGLMFATYTG